MFLSHVRKDAVVRMDSVALGQTPVPLVCVLAIATASLNVIQAGDCNGLLLKVA